MPNRVALVGAGGVGKTTLLKFFAARGYIIFPSITREFYASRGIKDESHYMNLSTSNKAIFQHGMRSFYRVRYSQFIADNPAMNIATDRSIFDHMAFGVYGLEDQHTHISIQKLINDCTEYSNDAYTHLIGIPYPQPWMQTTSIEDGFRNTDASKNYSISALMLHTIMHEKQAERLTPHVLMLDRSDMPPERTFSVIHHCITGSVPIVREEKVLGHA